MLLLVTLQITDTKSVLVNYGTVDREFTTSNSGSNSTAKENTVNVQTLKRCVNEKIDI